jgi:hypothetical protein
MWFCRPSHRLFSSRGYVNLKTVTHLSGQDPGEGTFVAWQGEQNLGVWRLAKTPKYLVALPCNFMSPGSGQVHCSGVHINIDLLTSCQYATAHTVCTFSNGSTQIFRHKDTSAFRATLEKAMRNHK